MSDPSYGEVTTIHINAKCSDLCFYYLLDKDGKTIAEHDGYVPAFFPMNIWVIISSWKSIEIQGPF
jgi:hypothetical protein